MIEKITFMDWDESIKTGDVIEWNGDYAKIKVIEDNDEQIYNVHISSMRSASLKIKKPISYKNKSNFII